MLRRRTPRTDATGALHYPGQANWKAPHRIGGGCDTSLRAWQRSVPRGLVFGGCSSPRATCPAAHRARLLLPRAETDEVVRRQGRDPASHPALLFVRWVVLATPATGTTCSASLAWPPPGPLRSSRSTARAISASRCSMACWYRRAATGRGLAEPGHRFLRRRARDGVESACDVAKVVKRALSACCAPGECPLPTESILRWTGPGSGIDEQERVGVEVDPTVEVPLNLGRERWR